MRAFLFALVAFTAPAAAAQDKNPGRHVDPATVAAYEKLGGVYGGMFDRYPEFRPGRDQAEEGFPAFRFEKFPKKGPPLPNAAAQARSRRCCLATQRWFRRPTGLETPLRRRKGRRLASERDVSM